MARARTRRQAEPLAALRRSLHRQGSALRELGGRGVTPASSPACRSQSPELIRGAELDRVHAGRLGRAHVHGRVVDQRGRLTGRGRSGAAATRTPRRPAWPRLRTPDTTVPSNQLEECEPLAPERVRLALHVGERVARHACVLQLGEQLAPSRRSVRRSSPRCACDHAQISSSCSGWASTSGGHVRSGGTPRSWAWCHSIVHTSARKRSIAASSPSNSCRYR